MKNLKENAHLWICGLLSLALFVAFGIGSMHPAALENASSTPASISTTAFAD